AFRLSEELPASASVRRVLAAFTSRSTTRPQTVCGSRQQTTPHYPSAACTQRTFALFVLHHRAGVPCRAILASRNDCRPPCSVWLKRRQISMRGRNAQRAGWDDEASYDGYTGYTGATDYESGFTGYYEDEQYAGGYD